MYAFSTIIEGLEKGTLEPRVMQALPVVNGRMKDRVGQDGKVLGRIWQGIDEDGKGRDLNMYTWSPMPAFEMIVTSTVFRANQ